MSNPTAKEHSHAQVLRWIADGKTVAHLGYAGTAKGILGLLHADTPLSEFTLAPRTIKVGSREINAPLDVAPKDGRCYWFIDSDGEIIVRQWDKYNTPPHDRLAYGNVWATEADATAARDAWRELMKGQV